jgi:hypothetical protein
LHIPLDLLSLLNSFPHIPVFLYSVFRRGQKEEWPQPLSIVNQHANGDLAAFSSFTAPTSYSGMSAMGPSAGLASILAQLPEKWKGKKTTPSCSEVATNNLTHYSGSL